MPKFTQALKDKWLEALRSGKYEQGRDAWLLKDGKYCCLGILCDVYGGDLKPISHGGSFIRAHGDYVLLDEKTQGLLANQNDSGTSFKAIADYIEKNIPAES